MAKVKAKIVYMGVGIFILFLVFLPGYTKFMDLRAKNIYLEEEIQRLSKENVQLYKEKKRLEEDIDYVEKVARDSMGLAREGEIPIKIETIAKER